METVNVNGRLYQMGQMYRNVCGEACILVSVIDNTPRPFGVVPLSAGQKIYAGSLSPIDPRELGTITDAPIELEDGDMCAFEYQNTHCMGFYNKGTKTFVNFGETVCCLSEAIMIAPLVEK